MTESGLRIRVNGEERQLALSPDTPLLWALRDHLGLTGTKFGCGIGACGACTVHLDGVPVRACTLPVSAVGEAPVETIEFQSGNGEPSAVQQAWLDADVAQCGYCQPGQIMAATALLRDNPRPTDAEIDAAMAGVVCRCGTYQRIREAIHLAVRRMTRNADGAGS